MICTQQDVLDYLGITVDNPDLGVLTTFQKRVERLVKRFVGYNVEYKEHIEYYPQVPANPAMNPLIDEVAFVQGDEYSGPGVRNELLQLNNIPVRLLVSVHQNAAAWQAQNGDWSDTYLLTPGMDYFLDWHEEGLSKTGHLYRNGGLWSIAPRSIRVRYQAGYTALELEDEAADFKLAVLLGITKFYNELKANRQKKGQSGVGPITSESLDGWSTTYAQSGHSNLDLTASLPVGALRILEPLMRMSQFIG